MYEYDFGDSWIHDLRLEATLPFHPRKIYPECGAGKCSASPEDCGGSHAFMANRQHYSRFDRERSDEDLDEIMDELDEEESDSFSDYNPDRFNRRQINRALGKLATGSYQEALDEIHHPSVDRISRRTAAQRTDPDD